jgi:hypothetical protein
MRLTEIRVRALKCSDTYVTHLDYTLPGFGILGDAVAHSSERHSEVVSIKS